MGPESCCHRGLRSSRLALKGGFVVRSVSLAYVLPECFTMLCSSMDLKLVVRQYLERYSLSKLCGILALRSVSLSHVDTRHNGCGGHANVYLYISTGRKHCSRTRRCGTLTALLYDLSYGKISGTHHSCCLVQGLGIVVCTYGVLFLVTLCQTLCVSQVCLMQVHTVRYCHTH